MLTPVTAMYRRQIQQPSPAPGRGQIAPSTTTRVAQGILFVGVIGGVGYVCYKGYQGYHKKPILPGQDASPPPNTSIDPKGPVYLEPPSTMEKTPPETSLKKFPELLDNDQRTESGNPETMPGFDPCDKMTPRGKQTPRGTQTPKPTPGWCTIS